MWFEVDLGAWVVKRRWWLITLTLLFVVIAASGIRFLTFNNDLRVFFSEKNPQLQTLEALENTYNKIDSVIFVIAPKDGDVFTPQTLTAIEKLTEASWEMPYSNRVDSITNFQHTRAEGDNLTVEDLVQDAENLSDTDIDRKRVIALSEPQLVNRLISSSGHVAGVNVTVLLPGETMEEVPEVVAFARKLAEDFETHYPGIGLYLTGAIMFDNGFAEVVQDDMTTLVPIMLVVLVIITSLSLRSVTSTFATLMVILISMITGVGLAGWLGLSLNPASANAPTIIMTLAVADSVHILVTMSQRMRQGKAKTDAIAESLRINLRAVFLTSVTTAIGFLTMNLSDAPPFRDLGNIVAMGVIAAFVYSVVFLPALMAVLPVRARPRRAVGSSFLKQLANGVISRHTHLYRGTWIMIVVATVGILNIELSDDWIEYFDKRYDLRVATDFMADNLSGDDVIEYSLASGESGGINDPAY